MKVQLFGGIEVAFDDAPKVKISAAKARWLLAFLALNVGSGRSVDSIIDALWHDRPPEGVVNSSALRVGGFRASHAIGSVTCSCPSLLRLHALF